MTPDRETLNAVMVAKEAWEADRAVLEAELRDAREALARIVKLNPNDSTEGYNEWGEAEMFGNAQGIALEALAARSGETP